MLVLAMFLVVLQVGVVLYTRNVLVAAAAEGARYGANADRDAAAGRQRSVDVVSDALTPSRAAALSVDAGQGRSAGGLDTVEVTIVSPLPVVFLPVGPLTITVRGHALKEGP